MDRYDVWVSGASEPRVRSLLESLNSVTARVSLPVDTWPATLNFDGPGPTFSGESLPDADFVVGLSTGFDVFGRPGWTPEKFGNFTFARDDLIVLIEDRWCTTLAVLASYLLTPILVDNEAAEGRRPVYFITPDGNVRYADWSGSKAEAAGLRDTFFDAGLEGVLAVPGMTLHPLDPHVDDVRDTATRRRKELVAWKLDAGHGKVAVPKGAELKPADFEVVGFDDIVGGRPVIGHARSPKHLYEVIVPPLDELGPLEVTCAVDGVLQRFTDPATGEDKGFGAHASDWAGWILRHTVPAGSEGPPDNSPAWEGDSPEAQMYRLSHNIVEYKEHESESEWFSTAEELDAWLKKSLGNHNAPIRTGLLDDVSFMLSPKPASLIQSHAFDRAVSSEAKDGYIPCAFKPWEIPSSGQGSWWDLDRRPHQWHPSLHTVMDGPVLDAYTALNCVDFSDVESHLLPAGTRVNGLTSWFVLWLEGTRTCIVFPAERAVLVVGTDDDGATAQITAQGQAGRCRGAGPAITLSTTSGPDGSTRNAR